MSIALPTSRSFLTQLLNALPAHPRQSSADRGHTASSLPPSNPFLSVTEDVKKQLLTLHVLFPHEFLPALDLLDRRLVTRYQISRRVSSRSGEDLPQGGQGYVAQSLDTGGLCCVRTAAADAAQSSEKDVGAHDEAGAAAGVPAPATGTTAEASRYVKLGHVETSHGRPGARHLQQEPQTHSTSEGGAEEQEGCVPPTTAAQLDEDTIYYVHSAQQRASRYSTSYGSTTRYEVRLSAWNCSCPAFAFSAFPSVHPEPAHLSVNLEDLNQESLTLGVGAYSGEAQDGAGWRFGGMGLGEGMPPVCKHILACVLVEHCGLFAGFLENKGISVEEAAGWAAGFGD